MIMTTNSSHIVARLRTTIYVMVPDYLLQYVLWCQSYYEEQKPQKTLLCNHMSNKAPAFNIILSSQLGQASCCNQTDCAKIIVVV